MKKSLKSLLNLTAFEFERISKFIYTLIGFTVASNIVGYFITPMSYINQMNDHMVRESATSLQAVENFGRFSFYNALSSGWIFAPIALGISGLLLYSFFIWYREWMGKNTFAYRLLMLPIPRMHIFYSKLIVIYLSIFTLISVQIISLFVGFQIVSAVVPGEWMARTSLLQTLDAHAYFSYITPVNPLYFLATNGIGLVFLLVLFTGILIERSYQVKGIVIAIVYGLAALLLSFFPLFLPELFQNYYLFYNSEIIALVITILVIIALFSIGISRHLLNKKITI